MTNQSARRKSTVRSWIVLVLWALGIGLIGGVPLGVWVCLNTWLEWTIWAVPLLIGGVIFVVGATVLTWDVEPGP
jgi:hypothetical protein